MDALRRRDGPARPLDGPTPLGVAALVYARAGLRVFPLGPASKRPRRKPGFHAATTDPATIAAWWAECPAYNIGVATGSGLIVLDIDPAHGGGRWWAAHPAWTPPTPTVRSGRGGRHLWYALPPDLVLPSSVGRLAPGVDVRGAGGYIVAPPSRHPNGQRYSWLPGQTPGDLARAPLDPRILALLVAPVLRPAPRRAAPGECPPGGLATPAGPIGDAIPAGQRNTTLASLAGTMRRRNMSPAAIRAALLVENAARCRPPLPVAEVERVVASICRYLPAPGAGEVAVHRGRAPPGAPPRRSPCTASP